MAALAASKQSPRSCSTSSHTPADPLMSLSEQVSLLTQALNESREHNTALINRVEQLENQMQVIPVFFELLSAELKPASQKRLSQMSKLIASPSRRPEDLQCLQKVYPKLIKKSSTPLHHAINSNDLDLLESLLNAGVDVNVKDLAWSALHLAAFYGQKEAVKLLLEKGAEVDLPGNGKQTALHLAAEKGHAPIVEQLLNHGATANVQDDRGLTPLHFAIENKNKESELLLNKRVNCTIKDI